MLTSRDLELSHGHSSPELRFDLCAGGKSKTRHGVPGSGKAGRRRVLALRQLNRPVLALVRDLEGRAALLAQGQENACRLAPTYLERALFAHLLEEDGFDDTTIRAVLDIDKTTLSRMRSLIRTLTPEVARLIGPARGIGRDRWTRLVNLAR